jgi:hypothetical protein
MRDVGQRCADCGEMVEEAWTFFETLPTRATVARVSVCVPCADALVEQVGRAGT